MFDQKVGKFVYAVKDNSCCCCCGTIECFYEIYFPADANLLLRLALIGFMVFYFHSEIILFGALPGTSDDVAQFIA